MPSFTESVVEQAALAWLESLQYGIIAGPQIAPDQPYAERADYSQVVLAGRLRRSLERLNPQVPPDAIEEAFRKLTRADASSLIAANRIIHKYLVDGVPVEFQRTDGSLGGDLVRVIDYDNIDNNEFLAVNQFTVVENRHERRPDVLPLLKVEFLLIRLT
jgi:type I restriction enzyme R subunit